MTEHNWDTWWEESPEAEIDYLTRRIFTEMEASVSFRNKTILELGCGTGRLSYLAMKSGAAAATLVDSSPRAVAIAETLFRGIGNVEIRQEDFTRLETQKRFDIVFSSGVVEHFRKGEIEKIIKLHRRWSRETVLTIVPAGPHYNNLRMKRPGTIRRFGWQRPLTRNRMRNLFEGAGITPRVNRRFYSFYAVPGLHGSSALDRLAGPLERLVGGLLLTVGKVSPANDNGRD